MYQIVMEKSAQAPIDGTDQKVKTKLAMEHNLLFSYAHYRS